MPTLALGAAILAFGMITGALIAQDSRERSAAGVLLTIFISPVLLAIMSGYQPWFAAYTKQAAHIVRLQNPESVCRDPGAWVRDAGRTFTCEGHKISFNNEIPKVDVP